MALPTPGASKNNWGDQLNDFLRVGHEEDGSIKLDGIALEADLLALSANVDQVSAGLDDANDAIGVLQDDLEGQVAAAIADDETVQTAITTAIATEDIPGQVETAVDAEIDGLDLVEKISTPVDDPVVVYVDEEDNETWLGIARDGGPTPYSLTKIREHIISASPMDGSLTGRSVSFVDENGKLTDLDLDLEGHITDRVMVQWVDRIATITAPTTDIICLGDSLTSGAGASSGQWYWQRLAVHTGNVVRVNSLGGDTSSGIAARQNGLPFLLMPAGGEFPASGSVTVTITLPSGGSFYPSSGDYPGVVAGIVGVLNTSAGTFTRTTAGDAVAVTRPQAFYTTTGTDRRNDIHVYWAGNNNSSAAYHDRVIGDIAAMVRYQTYSDRMLVVGVVNSSDGPIGTAGGDDPVELNRRLLNVYGRHFLDIRSMLIAYGLVDAGITPESQDTTDMANGIIPSSLRVDAIHLNAAGYDLVARYVANRLEELELT